MDFVESNLWLYAFVRTSDEEKRKAVVTTLKGGPFVVSSQVINEVCVNLIRKAAFDDAQIRATRCFSGRVRDGSRSRRGQRLGC